MKFNDAPLACHSEGALATEESANEQEQEQEEEFENMCLPFFLLLLPREPAYFGRPLFAGGSGKTRNNESASAEM
jgi:hypothetical protein